ncbi:hypothetical protein IHE44_0004785 [Lamprotornis superbus]|uniref:MH2 domain-containing protein n=1 Tax=Lamprotornis superbus TaxID=245042 RepID=A0A835NDW3_9PASS|nr:hypothetical protein IHE44_0004785 [Lamprotornis superbus]
MEMMLLGVDDAPNYLIFAPMGGCCWVSVVPPQLAAAQSMPGSYLSHCTQNPQRRSTFPSLAQIEFWLADDLFFDVQVFCGVFFSRQRWFDFEEFKQRALSLETITAKAPETPSAMPLATALATVFSVDMWRVQLSTICSMAGSVSIEAVESLLLHSEEGWRLLRARRFVERGGEGNGFCLGQLNSDNKSQLVQKVRSKIGYGIQLTREVDGVWVYNRSSYPIFIKSATLDNPDSRVLLVHKVFPGFSIKAFDYEKAYSLQRPNDHEFMQQPWTGFTVQISFVKGWGQCYTRHNTPPKALQMKDEADDFIANLTCQLLRFCTAHLQDQDCAGSRDLGLERSLFV